MELNGFQTIVELANRPVLTSSQKLLDRLETVNAIGHINRFSR